ncbi:MAG TPA: 2TM domain-containing protein [Coleofasciculaceae cyanobacterium]
MPPRWPRKPDRSDPDYRKLDDRMNFAVHVAIFAAFNSGIWFFRTLQSADWRWAYLVTGLWAAILLGHAVYIFAIADYSVLATKDSPTKSP